jgi:hypothetical protein
MPRMESQEASCSGCIRGKRRGLFNLQGQIEAKEWPVPVSLATELTVNAKIDRKRTLADPEVLRPSLQVRQAPR